MRFHEHIVLTDGGEIHRPIYAYGYSDVNVNFRYDRDPDRVIPIIHEECHLHVNGQNSLNGDELRFKTHETSFEEVFAFIANCFTN